MSSPNFPEADRETHLLWPADARIRNLTYGCNLYTDVTVRSVSQSIFLLSPPLSVSALFCCLRVPV